LLPTLTELIAPDQFLSLVFANVHGRYTRAEILSAVDPVQMVSHEGDRPISLTWRLETPLTAELFRNFSVLRG
jgi:hypothetical protein